MDRGRMIAIILLVISMVAAVISLLLIYQYWLSTRRHMCSRRSSCNGIPVSRKDPTETGPMIYFANGQQELYDREFHFNFKKVNGSWRAYILKMPDLNGRDPSFGITHRLRDGKGIYVCWNTAVSSLKDMQTISRVWANHIQEYIASGRRFG